VSAPPFKSAPALTPFTGVPGDFGLGPEPPRRRTSNPWADFEAWCTQRGLSSLPTSGPVVASYLLDRCREVDDTGALAHSAARISGWVDIIDAKHVQAGLPRIRSASPVPVVLSRANRHANRERSRQPLTAVRALQETLREIDRSFSEEAEKDRARALLLIGAVGELSDACLRSLRVGDVLAEPGDGLRISISSAEVVWTPLIRHAEFCPACSLVRWRRHVVGSESTLSKGQSMHVCVIGAVYPSVELERSPLFRRSVTGEPEALTVRAGRAMQFDPSDCCSSRWLCWRRWR
jgi:hypothetical protein